MEQEAYPYNQRVFLKALTNMPPIKRFSFNGSFVERVNSVMISGKEVARPEQKQPVRVRAIIANTKLSEREMRERFAEALQTTECAARR